jgi:hypothetical protein
MTDINTVRLVNGRKVASFTTVRGTGACTAVVGRAVQTMTLAAGRDRIAALLSDGWRVTDDEPQVAAVEPASLCQWPQGDALSR